MNGAHAVAAVTGMVSPEDLDDAPNRSVDGVMSLLGTSSRGLDTEEALSRSVKYGANTLREPPGVPAWKKFALQFVHPMALLLWVAGIVGFAAQLPQLGIAIWLVIIMNGVTAYIQEAKAERATAALKSLLPLEATVVRDGREQKVNAEQIVPGDVLVLEEGDRVTADILLFESAQLYCNQSNFTGESRAVRKVQHPEGHAASSSSSGSQNLMRTEYPNLVFASTNVVSGGGRGVVLRTGMQTEFGKVAGATQDIVTEMSPLQREVERTCKIITLIALMFGITFFLLAYFLAHVELVDAFVFSLGMVVAFVPEGMLPLVTLCLAVGTQRMAKRNVVVKKLSSVETLGSTTVICSDKTGTLTQNELTVCRMYVAGRELQISGVGFEPHGAFSWSDSGADIGTPSGVLRRALTGFAMCNNSRIVPPGPESERHTVLGDPTEGALKVAAMKAGIDVDAELARQVRVLEIPFTSDRRRMTTIHEVPDDSSADGERVYAFVKGSPDEIISRCDKMQWSATEEREVDHEVRKQLLNANDEIAMKGLRVLALAFKELPAGSGAKPDEEAAERGLTFLGLSGMMDPPRPEVPGAIDMCRTAGIRVVMITGDYGLTAASIASHIGLSSAPDGRGDIRVITGQDMKGMDDATLKVAIQGDCLFARVVPSDKLRVVRVFQELGHTVAVTGDGVNDAPALKQANIGVAMGITGTDVAKDAADMILTDDNFASIVAAVEEGRGAYANIKNFLTYILTSNVAEAVPFMVFVMSRGHVALALSVMAVLFIDLGTDMIPALALGADPPEPGVMQRSPRSKKDHLIDRTLLFRAFGLLGPLEAFAAMSAFFFHYWINGHEGQFLDLPRTSHILHGAQATAVIAVVCAQIGNLLACRTVTASVFSTPLFNNPLIWYGIVTEVLLTIAITTIPVFQGFFGTQAVPFYPNWIFCICAFTPLLLIADEVRKFIVWRMSRDKVVEGTAYSRIHKVDSYNDDHYGGDNEPLIRNGGGGHSLAVGPDYAAAHHA